jgi:hypothetical protein
MKPLLTAIAAVLFLLLPAPGFPAYIIHLHDGTRFVTDQYVEEGDQIRFKRYGGLIGIERALVRKIEEVENLPEEKEVRTEPRDPLSGAESEKKEKPEEGATKDEFSKQVGSDGVKSAKEKGEEKPVGVSEEEKKRAEQEKAAKMQELLEEKRRIMREKEAAITSYKEAKATKNMEKKNQYWNELLAIQKKLGDIRERAVAENGGGLPHWWDDAR